MDRVRVHKFVQFKLGIAHHFFSWISYSSRNILWNFQEFLQPVRPVGIRFSRFIESAGVEHWFLVIILIISPFSELGIAYHFFSWIRHSSRNILSNFQDFLQSVQLVGIRFSRFSRFIESASVEYWFLVIILIISPFSELGIAYRFFHGFLTLLGTFCQIFKIFFHLFDRLASGSAGSSSQQV